MRLKQRGLALVILCCWLCPARAELVVAQLSPLLKEDKRGEYFHSLIQLALEKTRAQYGDYRLDTLPPVVDWAHFSVALKNNAYPNLIVALPYRDGEPERMGTRFIPLPIDMGLLSYRICFVNQAAKEKVKAAASLADLRQFTIAQGTGWGDVTILRSNGFKVLEFNGYPNLFKVVIGGRADLFCRGVNELKNEYETFKGFGKLEYDESFALVYPSPWFFHVSRSNPLLQQRISDGLAMAYADGSLQQTWLDFYRPSIEFAKLKQRKIYYLNNPLTKNLPDDYKNYFIDPLTIE